MSDLVGVAEIAELLGVSRQRVNQIVASFDDFPAPTAELAAGRIWVRTDVDSWMARHPDRKPGRTQGGFMNFERFTDRARQTIVNAQAEANDWGHNYVGCEHVLIGLLREGEGVGGKALTQGGVTLEALRAELKTVIGPGLPVAIPQPMPFTPRVKEALGLAMSEALELGHNYIGTEHILLGILRQVGNLGVQMLRTLGAEPAALREVVFRLLRDLDVQVREPVTDEPSDVVQLITERFDRIEQRLSEIEGRLAAG